MAALTRGGTSQAEPIVMTTFYVPLVCSRSQWILHVINPELGAAAFAELVPPPPTFVCFHRQKKQFGTTSPGYVFSKKICMDNGPAYTPKWIFTWHQSHPCAETGQKCKDWNVLFAISQFRPFDHEKPCASAIEDESLSRNHYFFFMNQPLTAKDITSGRQRRQKVERGGRYTQYLFWYIP